MNISLPYARGVRSSPRAGQQAAALVLDDMKSARVGGRLDESQWLWNKLGGSGKSTQVVLPALEPQHHGQCLDQD